MSRDRGDEGGVGLYLPRRKSGTTLLFASVWLCVHRLTTAFLIGSTPALAAYTPVETPPLSIYSVFQNEQGHTFVRMSAFVNSNCAGGVGLYLYDLAIAPPVDDAVKERRKHKMAMALSAKLSGARVVIRYFHDPARAGNWDACYIDSIEIVD